VREWKRTNWERHAGVGIVGDPAASAKDAYVP